MSLALFWVASAPKLARPHGDFPGCWWQRARHLHHLTGSRYETPPTLPGLDRGRQRRHWRRVAPVPKQRAAAALIGRLSTRTRPRRTRYGPRSPVGVSAGSTALRIPPRIGARLPASSFLPSATATGAPGNGYARATSRSGTRSPRASRNGRSLGRPKSATSILMRERSRRIGRSSN